MKGSSPTLKVPSHLVIVSMKGVEKQENSFSTSQLSSYMSGMILKLWQATKRPEMATRVRPRLFSSCFCTSREVTSGWLAVGGWALRAWPVEEEEAWLTRRAEVFVGLLVESGIDWWVWLCFTLSVNWLPKGRGNNPINIEE